MSTTRSGKQFKEKDKTKRKADVMLAQAEISAEELSSDENTPPSSPAKKRTKINEWYFGRTDQETVFTDEDGNQALMKKAVAVDTSFLASQSDTTLVSDFESTFENELKTTPTKRPVRKLIFNQNGSPVAALTPGNSLLPRTSKLGPLSFFNNLPDKSFTSSIDLEYSMDKFMLTQSFQAVKKILEPTKVQEEIITTKKLQKTAHETKHNKKSRSQNAVMRENGYAAGLASANQYAVNLLECSETEYISWEWLHLIAFMVRGKKSQDAGNLVCASESANTSMMFIEKQLPNLAKAYPDGFKLKASAELLPGTHFAKEIHYFIKTDDFELSFDFDTTQSQKPHQSNAEYVHALFEALIKCYKETKNSHHLARDKLSVSRKNLIGFFDSTETRVLSSETTETIEKLACFSPIKKSI